MRMNRILGLGSVVCWLLALTNCATAPPQEPLALLDHAALCALAGGLLGPLLAVQVGMGESVLILAFVVIIIGGIGSIRGALVGSLIVGTVDTLGRALLPTLLRATLPADAASTLGPALASILIYLLMAGILFFKPQGLFPARA